MLVLSIKGKEIYVNRRNGRINILNQINKANIPINDIKNIFVTHSHIEHIKVLFGEIRKISLLMKITNIIMLSIYT